MHYYLRTSNLRLPAIALERLHLTASTHGVVVDPARCPSSTHACLFANATAERCSTTRLQAKSGAADAVEEERLAALVRLMRNSSRHAMTGGVFEFLYSPNPWLAARTHELEVPGPVESQCDCSAHESQLTSL